MPPNPSALQPVVVPDLEVEPRPLRGFLGPALELLGALLVRRRKSERAGPPRGRRPGLGGLDDPPTRTSGKVGEHDAARGILAFVGRRGPALGCGPPDETERAEDEALDERRKLVVVGQRADRRGCHIVATNGPRDGCPGTPVVAKGAFAQTDEQNRFGGVTGEDCVADDLPSRALRLHALKQLEHVDTQAGERRLAVSVDAVVAIVAAVPAEADGQDGCIAV